MDEAQMYQMPPDGGEVLAIGSAPVTLARLRAVIALLLEGGYQPTCIELDELAHEALCYQLPMMPESFSGYVHMFDGVRVERLVRNAGGQWAVRGKRREPDIVEAPPCRAFLGGRPLEEALAEPVPHLSTLQKAERELRYKAWLREQQRLLARKAGIPSRLLEPTDG